MSGADEQRAELAASAREEDIVNFVYDPSPRVIKAVLENAHLNEKDVATIAGRKNISGALLEAISKDRRWAESYPTRLALAKNPKTPLFVSLSIARYLRLFDLIEIIRCHGLPLAYRRKIEAIVIEKIPTMPLGIKKTLAKQVAGNVLIKMLQDHDPEVIQLCLNNPYLAESHLFKIISRKDTIEKTIRMIAEHPAWSGRTLIRYSLIHNIHTPLVRGVRFFRDMKLIDLRDLYADPKVPVTVKPFIHRELWERGERTIQEEKDEPVYEIGEEEMKAAEAGEDIPAEAEESGEA